MAQSSSQSYWDRFQIIDADSDTDSQEGDTEMQNDYTPNEQVDQEMQNDEIEDIDSD